jgi:hypothetical protein
MEGGADDVKNSFLSTHPYAVFHLSPFPHISLFILLYMLIVTTSNLDTCDILPLNLNTITYYYIIFVHAVA